MDRTRSLALASALLVSACYATGARAQVQHTRHAADSTAVSEQKRRPDDVSREAAVNTALDVLNGTVAGVNVTTDGLRRQAMLTSVRVRGTTSVTGGNDPLVVIDGVTSDLATLATVYPADIESFRVLKNASETAMYGARGASGVIEVTTKTGTGRGFQISYEGHVGLEAEFKHLKMLGAGQYRDLVAARGVYLEDYGAATDFQDAITRTGTLQNHYVAFSGGTPEQNYRASFGLIDHSSIIRTNGRRNFVAKLDATQRAFGDRLTAKFGVFGSSLRDNGIFDEQMLFYSAATMNPTAPYAQGIDGGWTRNYGASQINPPGALLYERDDLRSMNFNTHAQLTFNILPSLSATAFGSYAYSSDERSQFCPTWVWANGNVQRAEAKSEEWLANVALNFQKVWGIHELRAMVAGEFQRQTLTGFSAAARGLAQNAFSYDNLGAWASRPFGSADSHYQRHGLWSVMGDVSYTLLGRYTLGVTLRGDASSLVEGSERWGCFPSVSASWDVAKEPWLAAAAPEISMLKLRAGYGVSGNLGGVEPYATRATLRQNGIVSVGGTPTVTLGLLRNTNPDLTWETRSTVNVGLDLGLWRNRVVLTAEYYYSKTRDMLYAYDVPVPPFAYPKLMANLGSMSNSGVELGLSVTPVSTRDWELNVNLNVAFQRNRLQSLGGNYEGHRLTAADITPIGGLSGAGQHGGYNNVTYQIVGQPLGVFYLPHCQGIIKDAAGHNRFDLADLNGDGRVDLDDGGDRYIAGQATPKAVLGSNISLRFRRLYLALQMNGAFGHKIFNGTALAYNNMSSFPDYNVFADAPTRDIVDQNVSDYYLERGDYLNIEHLTVGYNVPLRSTIIRALRLSLSVSNLCTITGYSGLTPMINSHVVNPLLGIDDKRTYPLYRTYSLGVSIQF